MRRFSAAAALAVLAATAAACGGEKTETMHLVLIAPSIKVIQTDVGRPGPSPGDVRTFSLPLQTESGKPAGRLDGTTSITDQVTRGRQVREYRVGTVQLSLTDGNIVASGVYTSAPRQWTPSPGGTHRPIVGGTGRYRGARGELTQTPLPGNRIKNVLDIEVPAR